MRYLYADSEDFPLDYDFLSTLKEFLITSAECMDQLAAVDEQEKSVMDAESLAAERSRTLDLFATTVRQDLDAALVATPNQDLVRDVATEMQAHLTRTVESVKGERERALANLRKGATDRIAEQRDKMRAAVHRFLLKAHVPASSSRFRLELDADGHRYRMFAVCVMPAGLEAKYELSAGTVEEWQTARKVGDLVGELEIQVGLKKKFLTRDITRELAHVDDHYVAHAELAEHHATIGLKKKPDAPTESLVIKMLMLGDTIESEIRRPSERDSIFPAVPADLGKLRRLWTSLERASQKTLSHRASVSEVLLDGEPLFEGRRIAQWIERYVDLYQPIVAEIARRSPSPKELSLKLEHEDGKREELYLRRDDLVDVIGNLDDERMQVFAPLDFFPEVEVEME
jgi:hypothetical protein